MSMGTWRLASPSSAICDLRPLLLIPFLLLVGGTSAPAQQANRVTIDDALNIRGVGDVAMSPDGQWITYVVTEREVEPEDEEYRHDSNLWIVRADGGEPTQLTHHPGQDGSPRWAPDGSWLAFLSDRDDTTQVYGIRPDGGGPWPVTEWPTPIGSFRISPNGERLAFTASPEQSEEDKELEKRRARPMVMDSAYAEEYVHLWVAPLDGRRAGEAERSSPTDVHVQSFTWAPNSRSLAWGARPRPRLRAFREADVFVQDRPGAMPRRVTELPGGDNTVDWVDGLGLLVSGSGHMVGAQNDEIWLVDSDGSAEPTSLTERLDHDVGYVGASPDELLVDASIRTGSGLYRIPLSDDEVSGEAERVDSGNLYYDDFSVDDAHSTIAFVAEGPETPPDVTVSSLSEFSSSSLTEVNPQTAEFALGEQRVIQWESAAGGEVIEGVLVLPVGYEEGDRVPLLVDIHGGPAGVDANDYKGGGYAYPTQVFAGLGYAVLQPNYRGSTGYGERFRQLNRGHISGTDWIDVNSGVDYLIDEEIADPDRLGIMGWSFGGHHTYWGITQTDRFSAASAGAGANDLISMYSQTDLPAFYHTYLGPKPWEDFELYEARSAYRNVTDVTTPLLIQVGENDERVPAEQSIQFYEAIKAIGKVPEVRLIQYPGQGHGVREPRLQRDLMTRNVKWFTRWIPTDQSRTAGYATADDSNDR